MASTRRDSKHRVLRKGESIRANGKYQFKYHVDGKPHFVYSWRLEPTDSQPAGKAPCLSLRELEKQIGKDLDSQLDPMGKNMTVMELVERYLKTRTGVRPNTLPKRIEDVLSTSDDEIKFFITGTTEDYETYNYNLPVLVVDGKHPFYARAVMIYFPHCDRNQGVDYTSTEMDIHFGRVQPNGKLKTIDDNKQSEEGQVLYEEDAREIYRKWDNVKRVCEEIKGRAVPRKSYESGMWGISILTKDRVTTKNKEALQFGLVITLKEMYGKNRINEFIKSCMARNWLVTRLDVQNQVDIYTRAEEEIEFE